MHPPFGEYMHWNYENRQPYPAVCKVIRRHFLSFHTDLDREDIETNLPGIKYVWLHRPNNYARAISLYFSVMTKIWRTDVEHKRAEFRDRKFENVPFIPEVALSCYAEVASVYHNEWDAFIKKSDCLYIDYDDLIDNPYDVVRKVTDYVGKECRDDICIDSLPMTRPESSEYIEKLKELVASHELPSICYDSSLNIYAELVSRSSRDRNASASL